MDYMSDFRMAKLPERQTVRELLVEMDGLEVFKEVDCTEEFFNTPIMTDSFRENIIKTVKEFKDIKTQKETVLEQGNFYKTQNKLFSKVRKSEGQKKKELLQEIIENLRGLQPIELFKKDHKELLELLEQEKKVLDSSGNDGSFYAERSKALKKLPSLKRVDRILLLKEEVRLLEEKRATGEMSPNHDELETADKRLLVLEENMSGLFLLWNNIKDMFKK